VTATTHTEIYRRLQGQMRPARFSALPLWRARVHVALKRKLPLLILFVPPWISGVVFSFIVYTKFTLEQGMGSPVPGPAAMMVTAVTTQMIQVHDQIVQFASVSRIFALLVIAWFGAGLICEDKRAGAHLLYFSRPLTRFDYFLGHLLTACTFGAFVTIGPVLMICSVAVFSSPDYVFLREKWDVIAGAIGYAMLNVAVISMIVLGVSAVAARRTYAIAGVFAFVLGSDAVGVILSTVQRDRDWSMCGVLMNLRRMADWMTTANQSRYDWSPWYSLAILGGIAALAAVVIARRLRRLEVVA
jgi:ABC-type transport system involved in multi-copper enzyme maturation permease subunit